MLNTVHSNIIAKYPYCARDKVGLDLQLVRSVRVSKLQLHCVAQFLPSLLCSSVAATTCVCVCVFYLFGRIVGLLMSSCIY